MSFGLSNLDRASNDKCSVECLFWFFQPTWKADLKVVQITKIMSWLMHPYDTLNVPHIVKFDCSYKNNNNKYLALTPISTFDALSKWHEPDIIHEIVIEIVSNRCVPIKKSFLYQILTWLSKPEVAKLGKFGWGSRQLTTPSTSPLTIWTMSSPSLSQKNMCPQSDPDTTNSLLGP